MKKPLSLITLSLVLAGCSGGGLDPVALGGKANVAAVADNTVVGLDGGGGGTGTTNVTFKSAAGSLGVNVRGASVSFPGTSAKPVQVDLQEQAVPSGFTCPNAASNAAYLCGLQEEGSAPGERSMTAQYAQAALFQKAIQANPSARSFAVQFTGNVNGSSAAWTSNAVTFSYNPGQTADPTNPSAPKAPQPVLVINNTEAAPYRSILSVNVSAGLPAGQEVDKMTLQVVDARGLVDDSSYTAAQSSATFSVDTAKYPDGDLKLKAVVVTKAGTTGESAVKTVQIRNLVAPAFQIVSPTVGQAVSTALNASVQLTKQNTAFAITGTDGANSVTFNVRDYRNDVILSRTATFSETNSGLYVAGAAFDMNGALFPNNVYTLETVTKVQLVGESAPRVLTQQAQFTTQNQNNLPPALTLHVPTSLGGAVTPIYGRNSGAFIQMSDEGGVKQVQVQLTCTSAECQDFGQYSYNYPINAPGLSFRFIDLGFMIDSQPYVPDGKYTLRFTISDGSNTTMQEMPIRVSRLAADAQVAGLGIQDLTTTPTAPDATPEKLNYTGATWYVAGKTTHPVRLVTMEYLSNPETIGVSSPTRMGVDYLPVGSSIISGMEFPDVGTYRTSFLVEDLVTGVVRYYQGGNVVVKKNPAATKTTP